MKITAVIPLNELQSLYNVQLAYYEDNPSQIDYSNSIITDFKSYVQMTTNGDYDIVSKKKINKNFG
jgi:hypothetical protein